MFTSAYEGFGLPPLEAMACGTPAVVFDNSSLPEVSGGAAVVVPDGDAARMAEAVSRLLDDPAERERRRVQGLAWASTFTWRRAAEMTVRRLPRRDRSLTAESGYSFSVTRYSRYAPNMRRVCASSAGMTLSASPTTG